MSVFCGRDPDLKLLRDAWARISDPQSPHPEVITILGQPGLGKTRLVQEFFGWLSTHVDRMQPEGYWPDRLPVGETKSGLNPDTGACNANVPAPFLWFAFPLLALDEIAGKHFTGLIDSHISPHVRWLERERTRRTGITRALVKSGLEVAKAAGKFAIETLTPLQSSANLIEDFYKVAEPVFEAYGETPPDSQEDIRRSIRFARVDAAVATFRALYTDDRALRSLPVCIVIDDAQFSDRDEAIVHFLHEMLAQAQLHSWPILFLITSWEHEWHLQAKGDYLSSIASVVSRRVLNDEVAARSFMMYQLPGIADLGPLLRESLPGLTTYQVQRTLAHVAGHPRFLMQMIGVARGTRNWFVRRDLSAAFTPEGFEKFLGSLVSLHDAISERLLLVPEPVQQALCLSAMQDIRFIRDLTSSVADRLAMAGVRSGLEEAELPYAFVEFPNPGTGEFVQKVFFDVVRDFFDRNYDVEACRNALAMALHALVNDAGEMEKLSETHKSRVVLLAISTEPQTIDQETLSNIYIHLAALCSSAMERFDYLAAADYASRIYTTGRAREELGLSHDVSIPISVMTTAISALEFVGDYEKANLIAYGWHAGMAAAPSDPNDTDDVKYERLSYLGDAFMRAGDYARAAGAFDEAASAATRVARDERNTENRARIAIAIKRLGDALKALSKDEGAVLHYNIAAAIFSMVHEDARSEKPFFTFRMPIPERKRDNVLGLAWIAAEEPCVEVAGKVAWVLIEIVDILIARKQLNDAESLAEEVLERYRAYHRATNTFRSKGSISLALERVADIAHEMFRFPRAEVLYRECMTIKEEILSKNPSSFQARQHVAFISRKIGDSLFAQEKMGEAEQEFLRNRDILVALAEKSKQPDAIHNAASSIMRLADVLQRKSEYDRAQEMRLESLRMLAAIPEALLTPNIRARIANALNALASQELMRQQPLHAIPYLERSIEVTRAIVALEPAPQRKVSLAYALQRLAEAVNHARDQLPPDQVERMIAAANEALDILGALEEAEGDTSIAAERCRTNVLLGAIHKEGDHEKSMSHYQEALRIARDVRRRAVNKIGAALDLHLAVNHLGLAYVRSGDLENAAPLFQESLKIMQEVVAKHPTAANYRELAVAWQSMWILRTGGASEVSITDLQENIELRDIAIALGEAAKRYNELNPTAEAQGWVEEAGRLIRDIAEAIQHAEAIASS